MAFLMIFMLLPNFVTELPSAEELNSRLSNRIVLTRKVLIPAGINMLYFHVFPLFYMLPEVLAKILFCTILGCFHTKSICIRFQLVSTL